MDCYEIEDELSSLIEKAVKKQMVSDVPLGSYLSGGIDSGTLSSIASKHVDRLSTFTCGFDMNDVTGVENLIMMKGKKLVISSHLKTEQFEQVMNSTDIRYSLDKIVYSLEDLKLGMSYPNYYASNLASKFVSMSPSGE